MPSRAVLCTCRMCLESYPDGALIPKSTRQVHLQLEKNNALQQLENTITKKALFHLINPDIDVIEPSSFDPEKTSAPRIRNLEVSRENLVTSESQNSTPTQVNSVSLAQQDLLNVIRTLDQRVDCFVEPPILKFKTTNQDHDYRSQFTLDDPLNVGPCALDLANYTTRLFHDFESNLIIQLRHLSVLKCHSLEPLQESQSRCINSAISLLRRIDTIKEKHWNQQKMARQRHPPEGVSIMVNNSPRSLRSGSSVSTIVLFLCAILHLLFGLSQRKCHFVLVTLRLLLQKVFSMVDPSGHHNYLSIIRDIPTDIRTVLTRLDILPRLNPYVCCPKCCALYPCQNDQKTPLKCTYKETVSSEPCQAWLQKEHTIGGAVYSSSVKSYHYQDLPTFIGNLLRREQMEVLLERPLAKLQEPQPSVMKDIWDGQELRLLTGPDGKRFLTHETDELRLIFSLTYDNFTPFPKKTGRALGSVGAMFMVCLNLPLEIRYNLENIFLVGITPGPQAPSLTQLNHLLRPLVDDLEKLWKEGFYYSWTPNFPDAGRLARGAMIPVVADLHAIRQLGAFGSYSCRHFCTFCGLLMEDIEVPDSFEWPSLRTCAEHRHDAEEWLQSETPEGRQEVFDRTGIRWSELLRLPYWDPTRHTLYDTMHGWFLNVAENYINDILGCDSAQKTCGDGLFVSPRPKGSTPSSKQLLAILENVNIYASIIPPLPNDASILGLYTLCEYRGLRRAGTRLQLWRALHRFYSQKEDLLRQDIISRRAGGPNNQSHKVVNDKESPEITQAEARLLRVSKATELEDVLSLKRFKKDILLSLCERRALHVNRKDTKQDLVRVLVNRQLDQIQTQIYVSRERKVVLGAPSLHEINRDIARTILPSWVASGPSMLGARKSLKADEWRIVLLVRLTVTLPRLWSCRGPRWKLMLDHFVNLAEAIIIGGSGVIISDSGCSNIHSTPESYRQAYGKYLRGIIDLYPTAKIHPNTHLAYHVGDLLDKYGPVNTWRCNVFEHFNGVIQDIPTNLRFGQLEQTFMRTFCMASHLKSLLADQEIDKHINNLSDSLSATMHSSGEDSEEQTIHSFFRAMLETDRTTIETLTSWTHATYTNSALGPRQPMDQKTNRLLVDFMNSRQQTNEFRFGYSSERHSDIIPMEPFLSRLSEIKYRKRQYRRAIPREQTKKVTVAHQDSHILVKFPEESIPVPCSIQDIYLHRSKPPTSDGVVPQILLVIKRYEHLEPDDAQYDCWRRYPFMMGRLYYDALYTEPEFIFPDDIVSHFAKTPFSPEEFPRIKRPCIHVLPLNWDDSRDFSQSQNN